MAADLGAARTDPNPTFRHVQLPNLATCHNQTETARATFAVCHINTTRKERQTKPHLFPDENVLQTLIQLKSFN